MQSQQNTVKKNGKIKLSNLWVNCFASWDLSVFHIPTHFILLLCSYNLHAPLQPDKFFICSKRGVKTFSPRAKDGTPETIEGERFSNHENGSLQIISAEKEDSGEYECSAINSEGISAVTAVLEVKGISVPRAAHCFSRVSPSDYTLVSLIKIRFNKSVVMFLWPSPGAFTGHSSETKPLICIYNFSCVMGFEMQFGIATNWFSN